MPEASIGSGVFAVIQGQLTAIQVPATILNGQVTLTGTPTRDSLKAVATPIKSVTIESINTNAVVYVGNATVTTANGYRLESGVLLAWI